MTYIIGIDPGPVVGVCLLRLPTSAGRPDQWYAEVAQVTHNGVWALIAGWVSAYEIRAVAAESFVVGHRAGRVNDPAASRAARDVLGGLQVAVPGRVPRFQRPAATVKPWATDQRLKAAKLYIAGLPHARDATRHALFCAVHDFGARVPRVGREAATV